MTSNVNYAIRVAQINTLNEEIQKATKMVEYVLETNVDHEIILGKVQRQMTSLALSSHGPSSSRSTKGGAVGAGIFQGQLPNARNNHETTQDT